MNEKVSVFLPTRKNSERVLNKNTRDFAGVKGGLLFIKLKQLLQIDRADEVILSTNDEASMEVASMFDSPKLKIIPRPDHLCLSTTPLSELIAYVPQIISNEIILWTHTTSPFLDQVEYDRALQEFQNKHRSEQLESMASVTRIQEFLWDDEEKKMINFDMTQGNWPRTQDLKPLYKINSGFFISTRESYLKNKNRVSPNMAIYELDRIKEFDIDWEDDFKLAELIYQSTQAND